MEEDTNGVRGREKGRKIKGESEREKEKGRQRKGER
jgi:hypothetical protein